MEKFTNNNFIDQIKEKTANYEVAPPESVWAGVESHLLASTSRKTSTITKIGVTLGVIALIFVGYFINNTMVENKASKGKAKTIAQSNFNFENQIVYIDNNIKTIAKTSETNEVESNKEKTNLKKSLTENKIIKEEKIAENNNITVVATENNVAKKEEIQTPTVTKNKKEYVLNTTAFKQIKYVYFLKGGKEMLRIKAGDVVDDFWSIDVSSLPQGTYQIKIETQTNTINYKQVTFSD